MWFKKSAFWLGSLLLLPNFAFASSMPLSAVREAGEPWEAAAARAMADRITNGDEAPPTPLDLTAQKSAKGFNELSFDNVPAWQSEAELQKNFTAVRDLRYLTSKGVPDFKRRITWLYPDDGCPYRAIYMAKLLQSWQVPRPVKVFAFGPLRVDTPNSPAGQVSWWYHVAPLVRIGLESYVIDPAIDPLKPLPLKTWLTRMAPLDKIKVAICNAYTFSPESSCQSAPSSEDSYISGSSRFFPAEWNRQIELDRDPESVLGDDPPWKNGQEESL